MDQNTIIYEDPVHMTYMIGDRTGFVTRRATIEDLLSMNFFRRERGLCEVNWKPNYMINLAVKREAPKRLNPCPNCGANSWLNHICEYCGTEV